MADEVKALVAPCHQPKTLEQIPEITPQDVARNALIEGAATLPVVGGVVKEMANAFWQRGEYDRQKVLDSAHLDYIARQVPTILQAIERLAKQLNEQGKQLDPADLAAILEAGAEASRKTSGEKRMLLTNALENAFSLGLYQEGLVLRFFKILAELDYGAIFMFKMFKDSDAEYFFTSIGNPSAKRFDPNCLPKALADMSDYYLALLQEQGLMTRSEAVASKITSLGIRFYAFVADSDTKDESTNS